MKIELSLQPELDPEGCGGAENHHFFDVFLEHHFGMVSGSHFGDFGSLCGVPVGPYRRRIWDLIFDVLRRVPQQRLEHPPPKVCF